MHAVFIIAHPDDEIFASNLLKVFSDAETYQVSIVTVTDGGGGGLLGDPPLTTEEQLGTYRKKELTDSLSQYEIDALHILDYEDKGRSHSKKNKLDNSKLDHCLRETVKELQPQIIVSHGSDGEYGHPMHVAIHRSILRLATPGKHVLLSFWANAGYNVFDEETNRPDIADFTICSSAYPAHKEASIRAHQTQWQYFAGPCPSNDAYLEAIRSYAASHACESYKIVCGKGQQADQMLTDIKKANNFTLSVQGRLEYIQTLLITAIWRIVNMLQDLRYKIGLRTRIKRFFS